MADGALLESVRLSGALAYDDYGSTAIDVVPGAPWIVYAVQDTLVVADVGAMATAAEPPTLARERALQIAPNPVSETATLRFTAPEAGRVRADVFDTLGRRVAVPFDGVVAAGAERTIPLRAARLSPGVYVVRVRGAGLDAGQTFTVRR